MTQPLTLVQQGLRHTSHDSLGCTHHTFSDFYRAPNTMVLTFGPFVGPGRRFIADPHQFPLVDWIKAEFLRLGLDPSMIIELEGSDVGVIPLWAETFPEQWLDLIQDAVERYSGVES